MTIQFFSFFSNFRQSDVTFFNFKPCPLWRGSLHFSATKRIFISLSRVASPLPRGPSRSVESEQSAVLSLISGICLWWAVWWSLSIDLSLEKNCWVNRTLAAHGMGRVCSQRRKNKVTYVSTSHFDIQRPSVMWLWDT